jgi:hypothetical protein
MPSKIARQLHQKVMDTSQFSSSGSSTPPQLRVELRLSFSHLSYILLFLYCVIVLVDKLNKLISITEVYVMDTAVTLSLRLVSSVKRNLQLARFSVQRIETVHEYFTLSLVTKTTAYSVFLIRPDDVQQLPQHTCTCMRPIGLPLLTTRILA